MAKKMHNRGHNEGTIVERPKRKLKDGSFVDGGWMSQITIGRDITTGKPKRVTFYGKTRKEVAEKLSNALHDVQNGVFVEPSKTTFAEWIDTWLNEYAKPQVRPTTFDSYGYLIRIHIKPGLGGMLLKELQPSQIQKFYNQKLLEPKMDRRKEENRKKNPDRKIQFISARTVRYMHIIIHESLEQALKEGKIARNPAKATKPPRVEKKEASFLNMVEISSFLQGISEDRWYPAFITALGSGLRIGELTALKWSKIDLQKGVILVNEAVSRVKNGVVPDMTGPKTKLIFQAPKTKKSIRNISLPADVVNELRILKARQAEEKMKLGPDYLGDGEKHDLKQDKWFVLTWPDGRRVESNYLSKHFLKLIRKTGIPNIHFHSLRHYVELKIMGSI